jgi:hypothetical protein
MAAIEAVHRLAAAARLPPIACRMDIPEIRAPRPLHDVAGDSGHVAELRSCARENRLGEHGISIANRGMPCELAVRHIRAYPHAACANASASSSGSVNATGSANANASINVNASASANASVNVIDIVDVHLDLTERQPPDADQRSRRQHIQPHQIDQRRPAGEEHRSRLVVH